MDSIRAAKMGAIPISFLIAGYNFSFSQNTVPNTYDQPTSVSTPLFARFYYSGLAVLMPTAVSAAGAFSYLAYFSHGFHRQLYGTSAALVLGVGAWTRLVMFSGIGRLIDISKDTSAQANPKIGQEASELLQKWVVQNYFRGLLSFTAGMTGLYAALS